MSTPEITCTAAAPAVPKLEAPIVLLHGLMGFGELEFCGWRIASYFRGIPEFLRQGGNEVHAGCVHPLGSIAERAVQLKDMLDRKYPGQEVHLLAHSMGGLDARYMISKLDMASRVLSLTTIGTPHRGTAFADWGIKRLERLVKPFFEWMGIPRQAFYDLTTESCKRFNDDVPDAPGVRYHSVAGRHTSGWIRPAWNLPHRVVNELEGPNDGVVSVASASYGKKIEVWDGDHLSLINWNGKNRIPDYARLVAQLAER